MNTTTIRPGAGRYSTEQPPPDYVDPVVEAYKKDVDRTLLRQNLKLSVEQRLRKADSVHLSLVGWRGAAKRAVQSRREGRS